MTRVRPGRTARCDPPRLPVPLGSRVGVHLQAVPVGIVDGVTQTFAVEMEATDADGETAFSIEHRLTILPKHEVELLARLSPFDDWAVTGDVSGEPLADGHSAQAWTVRT